MPVPSNLTRSDMTAILREAVNGYFLSLADDDMHVDDQVIHDVEWRELTSPTRRKDGRYFVGLIIDHKGAGPDAKFAVVWDPITDDVELRAVTNPAYDS